MWPRISTLEVIRGLFLGQFALIFNKSFERRLMENGWRFSGIAFGLAVPTLVLLREYTHGHSLHGTALAFKNLGLLVTPLSFVILPSMSGLIPSIPTYPRISPTFTPRIILWRLEKLPGLSVLSEILIIGEGWIIGCCLAWYSPLTPCQAILGGLWVAFLAVGLILEKQLYPVPANYQRKKESGCRFLTRELFPCSSQN